MNEKRLLVVDDEPEFGEFVRKVAVDLGYEVQVTTNGRAFQKAYENLQPTTIVLDMVMPEMDGNEIVLWLMQQQYASNLIIITGYSPDYAADAKQLAEFKGLRSVTTLTKPIRLAKLRAVLMGENV
jgi:CheY-like chemotaxis protein